MFGVQSTNTDGIQEKNLKSCFPSLFIIYKTPTRINLKALFKTRLSTETQSWCRSLRCETNEDGLSNHIQWKTVNRARRAAGTLENLKCGESAVRKYYTRISFHVRQHSFFLSITQKAKNTDDQLDSTRQRSLKVKNNCFWDVLCRDRR